MRLRINQALYYANKKAFMELYKQLGLKWIEDDSEYGDGWFSRDYEKYLLKLKMDGEFKRFITYNIDEMTTFLKGIGATEETAEAVVIREHEIVDERKKAVDEALDKWLAANKESLEARGISLEVAAKFRRREIEGAMMV